MNSIRSTSAMSIEQQAQAAKMRKRGAIGGAAAGLLMAIFGGIAAFSPLLTGVSLAYLITGGLGLYGGMQTIAFFRTPREQRSGMTLVSGILLIFFSLFTLFSALSSAYGPLAMISALSSVIALFTVFGAAARFAIYMDIRGQQVPGATLLLVSSILNIVLGSLLLTNPIAGWFSLSIVWGIYLGISGLSLAIESLAGLLRHDA